MGFFVLFHILIWYQWISVAVHNCVMVDKSVLSLPKLCLLFYDAFLVKITPINFDVIFL